MPYALVACLVMMAGLAVVLSFERGRDAVARATTAPLPATVLGSVEPDAVRALRAYLVVLAGAPEDEGTDQLRAVLGPLPHGARLALALSQEEAAGTVLHSLPESVRVDVTCVLSPYRVVPAGDGWKVCVLGPALAWMGHSCEHEHAAH